MTRHLSTALPWLTKYRISYSSHISVSVSRNCFSTSRPVSRDQFVRDRENVNIVTLGASQHGKTTIASRLTKALAPAGVPIKTVQEIDHSVSERENQRSESVTHLEVWRRDSGLRFSLADLPGNTTYIKNSLNHIPHADLGLLVISPEHGVEEDTKLFAQLAAHLGVKLIVPVISMREDTDVETVDLINMELMELTDFTSDTVLLDSPLVSDENVSNLLSEIEARVTQHQLLISRDLRSPFSMAIEQVGSIPSRGTFCAGRVLQGRLTAGAGGDLEVFYQGKTSKVNVRDMEIFRKGTDCLEAGDRGGVFLKVKQDIELKRGAVLYDSRLKPTASHQFEVSLKCLSGRGQSVIRGDSVLYHSTTTDGKVSVDSTAEISEDKETVVNIKLKHKILARPGDKFVLRNNQTYLLGTILS